MQELLPDRSTSLDDLRERIHREGFAILDRIIGDEEIRQLIDILAESSVDDSSSRQRQGSQFARRNLLDMEAMQELASSSSILSLVGEVLDSPAMPVRGILFDKTADANWVVPWHQDLSIAVKQRIDAHGFGPWSTKAGVVHVQPPVHVLQHMLTIRLHLDDCDHDNGPLKVVAGSHRELLSPQALEACVNAGPITACCVKAGGAVVMRPMLVHASSPARKPSNRRVIHLEYAACELPDGLEWHAA